MAALTNRYVTLQKESTYGSEPVAATASLFLGEVDDESFSQNFDLLTRSDISRYGASKSVQGLTYSEGDFNLPLQLDDFNAHLLFNAFGTDAYDGTATPKTHTFTETTDDSNFLSYTVRIGKEDREHTYTGCVLNSVSISANINEYVMMSYSMLGCGESATSALSTPGATGSTQPPAFGTDDALHFAKAYVEFENEADSSNYSAMVKSISIDINLNRDTDNASSLGNATYAVAPPPQLREITGTIELNTSNDINGAATNNEPTYDELRAFLLQNGAAATPAIGLRFEDQAATANYLTLIFPKVVYEAPELNVSGRDTSTLTMNFSVLYDETEGYMAKMVMGKDGINGDAIIT